MSVEVKRRGASTEELDSLVGAEREFFVDTTKNAVVLMDGVTPGGHPQATETSLEAGGLWCEESGSPITFYPVPGSKIRPKITLTATQSGSGTQSPENVRAITPSVANGGKVTLSLSDGIAAPVTHEFTASQDIYGIVGAESYLDWGSKDLIINDAAISNVAYGLASTQPTNTTFARFELTATSALSPLGICDKFPWVQVVSSSTASEAIGGIATGGRLHIVILKSRLTGWDDAWSSAQKTAAMQSWLTANPLSGRYQVATPVHVSLAGLAQVNALPQLDRYTPRKNVIATDTGSLVIGFMKSLIKESSEAPVDPVMSLIETITVPAGGVNDVVRTQTPDGTPFNLSALFIRVHALGGTSTSLYTTLRFDGTYAPAIVTNGAVSSTERYSLMNATKIFGKWSLQASSSSATLTYFPAYVSEVYFSKDIVGDKITSVKVGTNNINYFMPAGSTIEIWGVQESA